jgi:hypothetical protein
MEVIMGNCKYCGKPVGLLSNKHTECENIFIEKQKRISIGKQEIINRIIQSITTSNNYEELDNSILSVEISHYVDPTERKALLVQGWEYSISKFLEDGILDSKEETKLVQFKERYELSQEELDRNGALTRITKAAIIREILSGNIPERMSLQGSLPINFQKGEILVWAFSQSDYFENKTRKTYVGASRGVSVRVMRGVYYRVGEFRGEAVERTERVHIDNGWVVITNKNLYFAGARKSVRIPYKIIVSFEPFSDGIGIIRDTVSAKPQIFVTGDGWFTYNLVTNLAKL